MKRLLLISGVGLVVLLAARRQRARRRVEVSRPLTLREGRASQPAAAPVASAPPRPAARPRRMPLLAAVWLFVGGVLVGGMVIPHRSDASYLEPDYAACIATARYQHPIQGNQYQELVNALYECDIYERSTVSPSAAPSPTPVLYKEVLQHDPFPDCRPVYHLASDLPRLGSGSDRWPCRPYELDSRLRHRGYDHPRLGAFPAGAVQ